jgi:hypothetical protein
MRAARTQPSVPMVSVLVLVSTDVRSQKSRTGEEKEYPA